MSGCNIVTQPRVPVWSLHAEQATDSWDVSLEAEQEGAALINSPWRWALCKLLQCKDGKKLLMKALLKYGLA